MLSVAGSITQMYRNSVEAITGFSTQGKRGIEKPPFDLPEFIKKTGIMEMRETVQNQVSFRLIEVINFDQYSSSLIY